MLNIFYQNKTLNDTLIINVSLLAPTLVETNGDITFGYHEKDLCFINIKNASKYFSRNQLIDGLLFPTKEIVDHVAELTRKDISKYFDNGFKVGLIDKCEEIKNTHLHKCVVDINSAKLNIVCGAPNARTGLRVVVATNGTMLPSGKQIVTGELLGNKSEGMLCSFRELLINKEGHGIIELNGLYKVGDYFTDVYVNLK